jgi:hypothetical protein
MKISEYVVQLEGDDTITLYRSYLDEKHELNIITRSLLETKIITGASRTASGELIDTTVNLKLFKIITRTQLDINTVDKDIINFFNN